MRSYEERAIDFLKRIYPVIHDTMDRPWRLERIIEEYNEQNRRDIHVYYGSARATLVTSDYVIKWEYDKDQADFVGGFDNEFNLYYLAEQDGFAYLFAKLTPFEYRDTFFCIMPRVRGAKSSNGTAWKHLTDEEKNWCKYHCLSDLHSGNYGFKDGKICIYRRLTDGGTEMSHSAGAIVYSIL